MAKALSRRVTIYINGKEVENTIKSLTAEMIKLEKQQKTLPIGSEEYVKTSLKIKEIKSVLEEQKRAIRDVGTDWEKTREAAAQYGNILEGLKTATGKIQGVYNWAKGYVEEAAKMDDAYADVQKTTGLTHDEVMKLNEAFKRMDTRTAREELNRLAMEAGKLGITGVEAVASFTKAADKIRVALGEDLGEDATTVIGKMAEVYTRSTKELSDAGDDLGTKMLRIGSAINSLGAASSAAEPHMVDFLARLGGMASQAGLSAQQVLGYASALDQSGVSVEKSATAFQNFMAKMMQKPAEFASIARKGVNEFKQLMETDMDAAIKAVLAGLNEEGGMTKLAPLFKDLQLSGQGVTTMLTTLKGSIDKVNEAQTIANAQMSSGASIEDEFAVKNNTLQAQMEKAKDRFHDTAEALGDALSPAFIRATNAGAGLISGMASFAKLVASNKAVLVGLVALMGNWVRVMALSALNNDALRDKIKSLLGIEKLQGHQQDALRAKTLLKTAAEEKERLSTINAELAKEKKIATMKVEMYDYDGLTRKMLAQERVRDLETLKTKQATVATEAHTAAVKAQKAAFASTPWGLIITALTTIGGAVYSIWKNSEKVKLAQTMKDVARQAGEAEGKVKVLFDRLRDAKEGSDDYKKALEDLKAEYPELISKHIDEEGKLRDLELAYKDLAAAARQSVYDRMYADKVSELYGEVSEQLQKSMERAARIVDGRLKDLSEAERTRIKQDINALLVGLSDGTKTYREAYDGFARIMNNASGQNTQWGYLSFISDLEKKVKNTDLAVKNLKANLQPTNTDPFKIQGKSVEQLNAELAEAQKRIKQLQQMQDASDFSPIGSTDYSRQIMDEQRRVEALTQAIKKMKDEKKKKTTSVTSTSSTNSDNSNQGDNSEINAWQKAKEQAEKLLKTARINAEDGLQRVADEVADKYDQMRESVLRAAAAAGKVKFDNAGAVVSIDDDVKDVLDRIAESEAAVKREKLDEYIQRQSDAMERLKKSKAGTFHTEELSRYEQASNRLNEALAEIDEAIRKVKRDAANASGEQRQQLESLVAKYEQLRQETEMAGRNAMAKAGIQDAIDSIEELGDTVENLPTLKSWVDKNINIIDNFANKAMEIVSSIGQLMNNMDDQELKDIEDRADEKKKQLDEQFEQGLISQEDYDARKLAIDEEYEKEEKEILKRKFEREKKIAVIQAIINSALAIIKCYTDMGPVLGTAAAILVGVATGLQIAAIENQPEPFAKGGFVKKKTYMMAGEAGPEWVASNQLLKDPQAAPMISALEAYQRGNRRALSSIPMAALDMPAATAAAGQIGRSHGMTQQSAAAVWEHPTAASVGTDSHELVKLMAELVKYEKDPRNRQAVISRQTMEDFENNEKFLREHAML